jgi:hypothetical protein
MAPTWREERPEAITAASHSAVRPSRSMVTIFSALSSSSDARMRRSRSLCGAGFLAETAGFWAAGFLAAGFFTVFADFFAGTFLAAFAAFGALAFFAEAAAGFLPAGFLAVLRVRAENPLVSGQEV